MASSFVRGGRGLFVALATLLATPGQAQILETRVPPIVADVVDTKGEETFTPVELGDWRDVVQGQDLASGDLLRTGTYGGLGISFNDRTYIRLHANSRMAVADPGTADVPRRLVLDVGRLWSRASRPDQGVIVETPTATAAIRGTDWFMEVAGDGTSRLVVLEGSVRFFNPLGDLQVDAGASAVARPGQAPEFELLVISQDRPRWAITPRSDWTTYLPLQPVVAAASPNMAPVWQAIGQARPRAAGEALGALTSPPGTEATLARALMQLMQRMPGAADKALNALTPGSLSVDQTKLAEAALIGAAIDLSEFTTALQRLSDYERAYGQDLTALALRAYLEAYAGRYGEAKILAETAARSTPEDWRQHLLLAQIAALQGNDDAFEQETARSIALAPTEATAWHWRALYLASAGSAAPVDIQSAIEKATMLNPERVVSIASLAQFQAAQGQPAKALQTYEIAEALDPTEPFVLAGKAFIHLVMDRPDLTDKTLAPIAGTPLMQHPEIQSVLAIRDLVTGAADDASRAAGRVIAASPDRPGIAQLESIAHWQAGRHAVAIDVIDNAVRLDPNDPVSARIASAMAQDQYQAGAAIDFARASWDAKRRNSAAGLVELPASQSGRIDIGGAFQFAGLTEQGAYYSSLARTQADANSAFGFAQIFQNSVASQSSTSTGLLLDPLSVTYPNRFATFFRAPMVQQTLDASVSAGSDGASLYQITSDSQRLIRTPRQPIALAGFVSLEQQSGPLENDTSQSALVSLRGGTVKDGQHRFIGRLSIDYRDRELPGSFAIRDDDDTEDTTSTIVELGYSFSESYSDRWMLRMTGGYSDRTFENPSAFGSGLEPLDYSLAVSLGLQNAQAIADRGLFDTAFSEPGAVILAVDPPADLPITSQVGLGLLALEDDLDPVSKVDGDITLLSLQGRRIFSRGGGDFSLGVEYGSTDSLTRQNELALEVLGAGAIVDFSAGNAVTSFDLGVATPLVSELESQRSALQAHAFGQWKSADNFILEAGVFPVWIEEEFGIRGNGRPITDETFSADPRLGIAVRSDRGQIRLALQRNRLLPGVDTIAPIGTLGLLPTENLGVTSERTDSAILRVEGEVSKTAFLHATVEYQDLENASAGLAGERLDRAAFFATDATLGRIVVGADLQLEDRLALSATYALNQGEIDSGPFEGADLPTLPEHSARLGLTWVDPRFFRATGSVSYLGKRYGDGANEIKLDDTWVAAAGVAFESRDKSWQFRIDGQVFESDSSLTPSTTESQLTLGLSRRW
ncbi:MAG: TonB-dependent receptor [Pseudomonadota bacterium]